MERSLSSVGARIDNNPNLNPERERERERDLSQESEIQKWKKTSGPKQSPIS